MLQNQDTICPIVTRLMVDPRHSPFTSIQTYLKKEYKSQNKYISLSGFTLIYDHLFWFISVREIEIRESFLVSGINLHGIEETRREEMRASWQINK